MKAFLIYFIEFSLFVGYIIVTDVSIESQTKLPEYIERKPVAKDTQPSFAIDQKTFTFSKPLKKKHQPYRQ